MKMTLCPFLHFSFLFLFLSQSPQSGIRHQQIMYKYIQEKVFPGPHPTPTSPDMTSSPPWGSHDIHKEITGVSHGQAEGLSGGGDFRWDRGKVLMLTRRRRGSRWRVLWVFVTMETRDRGRGLPGDVVTGGLRRQVFGVLWLAASSSSLLWTVTTVWSAAATSCSVTLTHDIFMLVQGHRKD